MPHFTLEFRNCFQNSFLASTNELAGIRVGHFARYATEKSRVVSDAIPLREYVDCWDVMQIASPTEGDAVQAGQIKRKREREREKTDDHGNRLRIRSQRREGKDKGQILLQ